MRCTWIIGLGLLAQLACGSSATSSEPSAATATPTVTDAPEPIAPTEAPKTPPHEADKLPVPPPISIPNGRLHDGYMVGGLPSTEQYEAAVDAGFDSAMSLMANDEPGIREIAPRASSLGVRYIRFTVKKSEDLNESMAWQFASTLGMLGKPAIIHSAEGERVGAMFALMAFFVDETSAEESIAIGRAAGMGSLEPKIRAILSRE